MRFGDCPHDLVVVPLRREKFCYSDDIFPQVVTLLILFLVGIPDCHILFVDDLRRFRCFSDDQIGDGRAGGRHDEGEEEECAEGEEEGFSTPAGDSRHRKADPETAEEVKERDRAEDEDQQEFQEARQITGQEEKTKGDCEGKAGRKRKRHRSADDLAGDDLIPKDRSREEYLQRAFLTLPGDEVEACGNPEYRAEGRDCLSHPQEDVEDRRGNAQEGDA